MKKEKNEKGNGLKAAAVIVFIIAIIFAALTAALGDFSSKPQFPKSPLTKINTQTHNYYVSLDLGIHLCFPSIPMMVSVTGDEENVMENGCVFLTKQGYYISLYEISNTPLDVLNKDFANNLVGDSFAECRFESSPDDMDIGYFNGYPAEYQCGTVIWKPEQSLQPFRLYTSTLTLNTGYDKDVMICVSTQNKKKIYESESLLEAIALTLMDTSTTAGIEQSEETPLDEAGTGLLDPEREEEVREKVIVANSGISSKGTNEDLVFHVDSEYPSGTGVIVRYSNVTADITDVYITLPDGERVDRDEKNGGSGIMFFCSERSSMGNWEVHIPEGINLGEAEAEAIELDEMKADYFIMSE